MAATAIIQTAFIGDVVLATPLYAAARKACPDDRIVGVVRKGCDGLIGNNPAIDEIIVWDKHGGDNGLGGLMRIARRLKDLDVRTALIPHRSIRSAAMAFLAGAKTRVGFAKGSGKLLHTKRVPYRYGIHEVERNLMLAGALGWKTDGFMPVLYPDERDRDVVDSLSGSGREYCVFAPGSVWATKQWPADYYIEVGRAMRERGLDVFVSGGMDDEALCTSIAGRIGDAQSTCGIMSLRQSAELYRRSAFVLTGDTAPQHIAAAMGAKVFALFGPTVRDFGFWPYSESGVMIEEDVVCRPCGAHGHRNCPEKHHHCMVKIVPENVLAIIEKWLDDGRSA